MGLPGGKGTADGYGKDNPIRDATQVKRWTLTPSQITADVDDWSPSGLTAATMLRVSADVDGWKIKGLATGKHGRKVQIHNIGPGVFLIAHDASTTASMRFQLPGATDISVPVDACFEAQYDYTSSRWRGVLIPASAFTSISVAASGSIGAINVSDVQPATGLLSTEQFFITTPTTTLTDSSALDYGGRFLSLTTSVSWTQSSADGTHSEYADQISMAPTGTLTGSGGFTATLRMFGRVDVVDVSGVTKSGAATVEVVVHDVYIISGGIADVAIAQRWTGGYLKTEAGAGSGAYAGVGGVIFAHSSDGASTHTDGTEDDLYSDTTPANTLAANNQTVRAEYTVAYASSATATRRTRAYFAGTQILDSGSLTFATGGTAEIRVVIIRESSSVVRVKATFEPSGITLQPIVTYTRITGLTLSGTNVLKITGVAAGTGAASGDITAKLGVVEWLPAP